MSLTLECLWRYTWGALVCARLSWIVGWRGEGVVMHGALVGNRWRLVGGAWRWWVLVLSRRRARCSTGTSDAAGAAELDPVGAAGRAGGV